MAIKFHNGIKEINKSEKPIEKAWQLSFDHLQLDNKVKKLIEILGDHENLLINYNPYHNHYHIAEVIWGSAFLAKQEKFQDKYFESMVILLLAATFHDAEHVGRGNRFPFELEKESAKFFKNWWKNNSLFVENIIKLSPTHIENAVTDLILGTDFNEGHSKVARDYQLNKDLEVYGLKMFRLKEILNESDLLMNCLPYSGFNKTGLILKESTRNPSDEQKWLLLFGFLKEAQNIFISDAAKELKIDVTVKKFTNFLHANKERMKDGLKLQQEIEEKFKTF